MVSAEGIARGSLKSFDLLQRGRQESIWGVQLFGSDPQSAAAAVRLLEPLEVSLFDLNCGCSVPKVLKSGSGSALLQDPERIRRLVRAMTAETRAPVSVKLRSGWSSESLNYRETAEAAVAGGASMVCLHPRTRRQGFSGAAQWGHIAVLKTMLSVPVIGSGDLFSPEDAVRMMRETGCDGVMFARGALGNPFVFAQTRALLRGETPVEVPDQVRLETALEQLRRSLCFKPEPVACREMRKHFSYYSRGIHRGAELRRRIVGAGSLQDYQDIIKAHLDRSDGIGRETVRTGP
jgi:tRNA-dihydrouridine synthase B